MSSHTKPETDRVFAVIDAKDIHGFIDLLAEDARLFFGNAAPMVGRGGITAGVEEFYATIAAVSHQVVNTWTHRGAHHRSCRRHLSAARRQPGHRAVGNDLSHQRCRQDRRVSDIQRHDAGVFVVGA